MAGKRVNLGSLAGTPTPPEMRRPQIADVHPTSASVDDVAPNPLNPRRVSPNSPAVRKIRASIKEIGQIQPSTVVTRRAFLAIHPEREDAIGAAPFVLVAGEQRRAAVEQLDRNLKISVDDELAATRARFLSATLAENFKRKNLNPVEEAHGVRDMVAECGGSQKDAAKQLGFTAPWVTQRLNLLRLVPEVQAALIPPDESDADEDAEATQVPYLKISEVRDWHTLDESAQHAALARWRRAHQPAQDGSQKRRSAPTPRSNRYEAAAIRWLEETAPEQIAVSIMHAEMPPDRLRVLVEQLTRLIESAQPSPPASD